MIVGDRIRALRESLNLSQGDIEDRSGLLRCYISRVENGHTVPSVETIQKLAGAMGVPLYRFFYEGAKPPEPIHNVDPSTADEMAPDLKSANYWKGFRKHLSRMKEQDRKLLLFIAKQMANRHRSSRRVADTAL
jgi:transcriptional regulator with XRE-family HTH domain